MAAVIGLLVLWVASGVGVYTFLAAHRTDVARQAARPNESGASVNPALARLPGTLYVVQDGALYRLQQGKFAVVLPSGGWTQPSLLPGGQGLILVRRDPAGFSDLYRVDGAGHTQQLTSNQGQGAQPGRDPGDQLVTQYWAMYPRASADGSQLYFATDRYKHQRCCPFDVTMRLVQIPVRGGSTRYWTLDSVTQSDPHTEDGDYAGGDTTPLPLSSGSLLFVRYSLKASEIGSELMLVKQAKAAPVALTAPEDDCSQPAISPDGGRVAMICTYGKQMTSLEVAAFDGSSLGARTVVVSGVQAAQPVWSPDGLKLLYLAPVGITGHFQLWSTSTPGNVPAPVRPTPTRGRTATPTPVASSVPATPALPQPTKLTDNLNFDATSPIAWSS